MPIMNCFTCGGGGTTTCGTCGGSGYKPAPGGLRAPCGTCSGSGRTTCSTCGGRGKVGVEDDR